MFLARLRLMRAREAGRSVDGLIEELELAEIAPQRIANCSTGMVSSSPSLARSSATARALLDEPTAHSTRTHGNACGARSIVAGRSPFS